MTPEEKAFIARFKPKVEPTSKLISPLYDKIEVAIGLIDCAYFATYHNMVSDEIGDPLRATIDEGQRRLREIKDALYDMIAWVP